MKSIDKILEKYWGYTTFRPLQREVIESIIAGHDTIALMPTGGGKSITYQVSAMAMKGICLVVTPLISLMKDQVDALRRRNILAQAIHSGLTAREIDRILDNCLYGDYKFLYVSPERLETEIFRVRFARMEVSMIAVDEAHSISQWGYDFRPAYLKIASLRKLFPDIPFLAVTATATQKVIDDIADKLEMASNKVFKMSFARSNLSYLVREVDDKKGHIIKVLSTIKGSGIVYCSTRKECEEISEFINGYGLSCDFYHGGLSYPLRTAKQEAWLCEQTKVIVATNAFGMGIDKSNVRFVIHHNMPNSLEGYYQEAGRAGRDGLESYAVLLYNKKDSDREQTLLEQQFLSIPQIKEVYNLIFNHFQIAIGEGANSILDFNIYDFCSKFRLFSGTVISAIDILQICGYMTLTDNSENPTRIRFSVSRDELYRIEILRNDLENFISILMRVYTGLFSQFVSIDENYLASVSGYTVLYINETLLTLSRLRVLNYIPGRKTPLLILHNERLALDNLRITPQSYTFRHAMAKERLDGIIDYVQRKDECRSKIIQHYFNDPSEADCGKCDICRAKKRQEDVASTIHTIKEYIIAKLSEGAKETKLLALGVKCNSQQFSNALNQLFKEDVVKQSPDGNVIFLSSKVD